MTQKDLEYWYNLLYNGTHDDKIIARQVLGLREEGH